MKHGRIVIAGGSGFIGRAMQRHFASAGWDVVVLTRDPLRPTGPGRHVAWDGRTVGPWAEALGGAAAVVNLAGRSVDCRYHARNRREILASRVDSVRVLAEAMGRVAGPSGRPAVWVQAATTAIYGESGDAVLDESAAANVGFSPGVATAWERAFEGAAAPGVRKVLLRISFVIGPGGGAVAKLARLARRGMGGTVGSGRQWVSWIDARDLCRLTAWAIDRDSARGLYHATCPAPLTNEAFMREIRRAAGAPLGGWAPRTPAWAVRVGSFFLRTEAELALKGRRCVPARAEREGFVFEHTDIASSLRAAVAVEAREAAVAAGAGRLAGAGG